MAHPFTLQSALSRDTKSPSLRADGWRIGEIDLFVWGLPCRSMAFDGVDCDVIESGQHAIQDFSAGRLIRASRD